MTLSISILLGAVAILLAVALYKEMTNQLHSLDERVKKLEEANPKRINYQSLEEIENAMSELVVFEMEQDLKAERIKSIKAHLAKAHTPTTKK